MGDGTLRVLKGTKHPLPYPLLSLHPPCDLKGRILAALRSLDAETQDAVSVLQPITPPVALKRKILKGMAELRARQTSDSLADEPQALFRRASGHSQSRKERFRAPLRHRPERRRSAAQLLGVARAIAGGVALVMLVLVAVSAARLVRTRERVAAAYRKGQEARERANSARRAEEAAHQRLAELQAQGARRQASQREAEDARDALAIALHLGQRSNESLQQELQDITRAQWREIRSAELADKTAKLALRGKLKALHDAEEMESKLADDLARIRTLEGTRSAMITELK